MRSRQNHTHCLHRVGSRLVPVWLIVFLLMPHVASAAPDGIAGAAPQPGQAAPQAAPGQNAPQRLQPAAAFALVSGEAAKGKPSAMLDLGRFYEQGVGTARNYTKALEWYEKAAQAGQAAGFYNSGVCYEVGMGATANPAKALQNFHKAAEMGMTLAMHKIASMCFTGTGVTKDTATGILWLEKAANAGMAVAANDLGAIYVSGLLGQKKDEKKALSFFMKAADLGNIDAIRRIADMHKDGIGTKADPVTAYSWYTIARRGGATGEDVVRMLGLLEGTLSPAQVQLAHKTAETWLENYARRQPGK